MEELGALRARLLLEAEHFKRGMQQAREELQKTDKTAKEINNRFEGLDKSLKDVGLSSSQIDKIKESIGKVRPDLLEKDLSEVRAELQKLGLSSKEIDKITQEVEKASKSTKNWEEDIDRIHKAALGLGAAFLGVVGASVKTAVDFEKQMSRVKAISGATEQEFEDLKKSAMELGAVTTKSASEVAIAFEDMAAKGFDATEIIAAMPGVIAAAEASGSDLAATSDVVTSALNSFHLEAAEATRVADVLAMAANVSAANVTDMGYAFKYAAPIAYSLGISMEELAAATGIMVDAGLAGEQAGTTLRMSLLRLADPTKEGSELLEKLGVKTKDAQGNFLGLSKILPQFEKGLKNMTNAQKAAALSAIFGTEAVSGMLTLIEGGVDQYNEFTKALENSTGASKIAADIMMDNVAGAWEEFMGALETAGIKIGNELLPLLKEIILYGADIVNTLSNMDSTTIKAGIAFSGTAVAIGLTVTSIGKLIASLRTLMLSMGPAGWLIAGLSILGGLWAANAVSVKDFDTRISELYQKMEEQSAFDAQINRFEELHRKNQLTSDEMLRYMDILDELKEAQNEETIKKLSNEQDILMKKSGLTNEEMEEFISLNDELVKQTPGITQAISEQGNAFIDNLKILKEINEEKRKDLVMNAWNQLSEALQKQTQWLEDIKTLEEEIANIREKQVENQNKQLELGPKIATEQAKLVEINKEITELQALAKDLTGQEAIEMANKIAFLQAEQREHEANLRNLESERNLLIQNAQTLQASLETRQKDLEVTQDNLNNIERLVDDYEQLVLAQVELTSEKGNGLIVLNQELEKIQSERIELKKLYDQGLLVTAEYQEQVSVLNKKEQKLKDAKRQLESINTLVQNEIYKVNELNNLLGKPITKSVTLRYNGPTPDSRGAVPISPYHTGGIVGKKQMPFLNELPKLHVGGLVSQLMKAPMHNEIDVRLLGNEMVLTEAQQANLLRLIDAGFSHHPSAETTFIDERVITLLQEIQYALVNGLNATVVMDSRVVGQILEPEITQLQRSRSYHEIKNRGR